MSLYYIPPIFFYFVNSFYLSLSFFPFVFLFPFSSRRLNGNLVFFLYFCLSLYLVHSYIGKEGKKNKKKLSMMFDTRKGVSAPWLMLKYTGRGENKNTTKKIKNKIQNTRQDKQHLFPPRITRGSSHFWGLFFFCPSIDANVHHQRKHLQ